MTVSELRTRMSADEFLRWQVFHARRAQELELAKLKAEG